MLRGRLRLGTSAALALLVACALACCLGGVSGAPNATSSSGAVPQVRLGGGRRPIQILTSATSGVGPGAGGPEPELAAETVDPLAAGSKDPELTPAELEDLAAGERLLEDAPNNNATATEPKQQQPLDSTSSSDALVEPPVAGIEINSTARRTTPIPISGSGKADADDSVALTAEEKTRKEEEEEEEEDDRREDEEEARQLAAKAKQTKSSAPAPSARSTPPPSTQRSDFNDTDATVVVDPDELADLAPASTPIVAPSATAKPSLPVNSTDEKDSQQAPPKKDSKDPKKNVPKKSVSGSEAEVDATPSGSTAVPAPLSGPSSPKANATKEAPVAPKTVVVAPKGDNGTTHEIDPDMSGSNTFEKDLLVDPFDAIVAPVTPPPGQKSVAVKPKDAEKKSNTTAPASESIEFDSALPSGASAAADADADDPKDAANEDDKTSSVGTGKADKKLTPVDPPSKDKKEKPLPSGPAREVPATNKPSGLIAVEEKEETPNNATPSADEDPLVPSRPNASTTPPPPAAHVDSDEPKSNGNSTKIVDDTDGPPSVTKSNETETATEVVTTSDETPEVPPATKPTGKKPPSKVKPVPKTTNDAEKADAALAKAAADAESEAAKIEKAAAEAAVRAAALADKKAAAEAKRKADAISKQADDDAAADKAQSDADAQAKADRIKADDDKAQAEADAREEEEMLAEEAKKKKLAEKKQAEAARKEAQKQKEAKAAADAAAAAPLCEVSNLSIQLEAPDASLLAKYTLARPKTGRPCSNPASLKLELSASDFGTSDSCVYTIDISAAHRDANDVDERTNTFTLPLVKAAQAIVPSLDYFVRLVACKDTAVGAAEQCVRANSKLSFRRLSDLPTPVSNALGVRLIAPTVLTTAEGLRGDLRALDYTVLADAADAIGQEISLALEQRTGATSRRIAVTIQTDPKPQVQIDVLPPPTAGLSVEKPISAAALAEEVRCMFGMYTPSGANNHQKDALLALLAGVETAVTFDPCEDTSTSMCASVRVIQTPPPFVDTDLDPVLPPAPISGPQANTDEDVWGEFPKSKVEPAAAPTDLPGNDEFAVDLSEGATKTKPVNEEHWYDVFMVSPTALMLGVGAILAVTFWALCIRTSQASPTQSATEDDEDLELGGQGVEMGPTSGGKSKGSKNSAHGAFTSLSVVDDDADLPVAAPTSSLSASSGSFSNEKEEGSASKFLVSVLISIGIPSFGTTKYSAILKDNYLSTIGQLKQLDNADFKRLGLPLVIEEALRKTLAEHTNKEGRFADAASASGEKSRAKGLDLKAAKKSPAVAKDAKSEKTKKKNALSVSALESPLGDVDDPFNDAGDEPALLLDDPAAEATAPSPEKKKKAKGSKKKAKASLLLAPPENDTPRSTIDLDLPIADATSTSSSSTKLDLDDDWLESF